MIKYLLVQTAIGDYRQHALSLVVKTLGDDFVAFAGDDYFSPSVKTNVDLGGNLRKARNHFLLGRKLLWQSGVIRPALTADTAILEFNPRILTNWIILIGRRLTGKKTLIWGHAWSRSGPAAKTESIRRLMRRLSDGIIVYTEAQKAELRTAEDPSKFIIAAPNALYSQADMQPIIDNDPRNDFIYVGRLVEEKKPGLLIDAFRAFSDKVQTSRLHIVGDGPLNSRLRQQANDLAEQGKVLFHGHVNETGALKRLYAKSIASVSPGSAGLSITQSLGFGVPMIISRDEPHGPEIECAENSVNCIFFNTDSITSLTETMLTVWKSRGDWTDRSTTISQSCREKYSAETMSNRLIYALQYEG